MSKPQSNYLFQWFDPDNNDFLVNGKVYTYVPGTTTDKATYSDYALTTANANPVVLDSYGSAIIYLSGPTKFVVKDADGVTVDTQDFVGTPGESWYDASFYGTAGTQAAIVAALAAISTNDGTLYLKSSTWSITSDLTIPRNVNVRMETGAKFSVATAKTLTINGNIEAGPYQIFAWAGTGATVISGSPVSDVYMEWWGAVVGKTNDVASALTKCLASIGEHQTIRLLDGIYRNASAITHTGGLKMAGCSPETGTSELYIDIGGSGYGYSFGTTSWTNPLYLKDVSFIGPATCCDYGVRFRLKQLFLDNVRFSMGAKEYAASVESCIGNKIDIRIQGINADADRVCPDGGIQFINETVSGWQNNETNLHIYATGAAHSGGKFDNPILRIYETTGSAIWNISGVFELYTKPWDIYGTNDLTMHDLYIEGAGTEALIDKCKNVSINNILTNDATVILKFYRTRGVWINNYDLQGDPSIQIRQDCRGVVIGTGLSNAVTDDAPDTQFVGYISNRSGNLGSVRPSRNLEMVNFLPNADFSRWNATTGAPVGWSHDATLTQCGTGLGDTTNHWATYSCKFVTDGATSYNTLVYTLSATDLKNLLGKQVTFTAWVYAAAQLLPTNNAVFPGFDVTTPTRVNGTAYKIGDAVKSAAADLYWCVVAGTSDGAPPAFDTTEGNYTTDGTVTWFRSDNHGSAGGYYANADEGLWKKICQTHTLPANATAVTMTIYFYDETDGTAATYYIAEPSIVVGSLGPSGFLPSYDHVQSAMQIGANRVFYGAAVPAVANTWYQAGDICINTSTALPSVLGWQCKTSGVAGASVWRNIPNVVYGSLTLDNGGGTTTTVNSTAVLATSAIILTSTSAAAAAAVGGAAGVYVSTKTPDTSFVVTHPATPGASATMDYVIIN